MASRQKPKTIQERPKIKPYGDMKIQDSKGYLEQMRRETSEVITKIRSHTDALENQRRIEEENARKDRATKIQTEVITSHKRNVEIDWTWQELEEKEDCEELAKDIEVQKEACKQIIQQKDLLIQSFMEQLRTKDDEYMKSLKKQNDYIEDLIKSMQRQFIDMRVDYSDQLDQIEASFLQERQEILNRNDQTIKDLFKLCRAQEEKYALDKRKMQEKNNKELEQLKTQDANDQAEQKIKLEKEMQVLQKCMEDMKAVFRLNEEKLKFNHNVLGQRERVNEKEIVKLVKTLRKSQETWRRVGRTSLTLTQNYEKQNRRHTKDYKKFTNDFLMLQKKFERFENSDKNRFNEIWSMNQNEVRALCEKIMDCDRVIHVQQLGLLSWQPPTDPIFKFQDNAGAGAAGQTAGQSVGGQNTSVMDSSKHGMSKSEFVDDGQMSNSTGRDENTDLKDNFHRVKNVFEILIGEAPYLIEEKAIVMSEGKSKKDRLLIMIDSIRKSLGIESMEDVQLLVQTFYEFGDKKKAKLEAAEEARRIAREEALNQGENGQQSTEKDPMAKTSTKKTKEDKREVSGTQQQQNEIPTVEDDFQEERDPSMPNLDMDDVTEALEEFIVVRQDKLDNADPLGGNPALKKKSNFQTDEQKAERQKREEKIYWERMTKVLSDKGLSIWKALDKALTKYYALLVERQNLIEETGLLNQQNEELKTLLNQYLQAGVNHDLQVPPTQVIRLDI